MNKLYIVVPCYKEEAVLPETSRRLKEKLAALQAAGHIAGDSRVLFVDDGSSDRTWEIIEELHAADETFSGLKLSRNRGHQNALLAGLAHAAEHADVIISMDADLQDDIGAVDKMLEKYREGCEVVYGVRSSREKDTFFKRATAQGFYRFMQMMGVDIVYNHADYRLLSQRAAQALMSFTEVNLFLRGLVPLVGFKSGTVTYERGERFAGESKYPLKKMIAFALDGITSFSIKPIRLILALGVAILIISVLMLIYSLLSKLWGSTVSGWTSLVCSIWALGGIQMISLGVIGEYIGKIYNETKRRPRFIIETVLDKE
ncbi:MAG: glycosyltransferase family 2 protein [Clostridia bacterium]|nr:glycosyltransferase family 2 protein [Clostridia bacterium]